MSIFDNVFDGLLGFEKLMLICGFILFVFALAAITVMIVQRRKFAMAMGLIVLAIVLMGFPGIQAVKFSQDSVELTRIRTLPSPADPAQQRQAQQVLANLEQRAEGNPQLQAKVADGYRAIGEVDKAYRLAQSLIRQNPSAQVQATLVPVLTAKLNQVQADAPLSVAPRPRVDGSAGAAARPRATAPALAANKQRQIASIAKQLQATPTPLPADSHAALAKAYVALGQPRKAQASVEAARRINPRVHINSAVLRVVQHTPPASSPPPEQ